MAYSTKEQVRQLLKGVVEITGAELGGDYTPDKLSDDQIEYEIRNADEQINASLRRQYKVPLEGELPVILNTLSVDIAASLCDMTFRASREYANELSPFRLRYERANLLLERIAEGTYPIFNEGESPENPGGGAIVINPYDGQLLEDRDVFPRGGPFVNNQEFGERIVSRNPHRMWGHW